MKLPLSEIWEFLDLLDAQPGAWQFDLITGEVEFHGLSVDDLISINESDDYDPELLPSIFTYREILWQPNVYSEPQNCLPSLNLLNAYCKEFIASNQKEEPLNRLYNHLLKELSNLSEIAVSSIKEHEQPDLARILGNFRNKAFPIVKFFIWHPRNRAEHVHDALNRLNYTVKILLTQYRNDYGQLHDPFWEVTKIAKPDSKEVDIIEEEQPVEVADNQPVSEDPSVEDIARTVSPKVMVPSETT